jgi:hypothetical protein
MISNVKVNLALRWRKTDKNLETILLYLALSGLSSFKASPIKHRTTIKSLPPITLSADT